MFDEDGRKIDLDTPRERKLTELSKDEMNEYILWLETEIARVKTEITARGDVTSAADALFK